MHRSPGPHSLSYRHWPAKTHWWFLQANPCGHSLSTWHLPGQVVHVPSGLTHFAAASHPWYAQHSFSRFM
jgi:hypothetical protein